MALEPITRQERIIAGKDLEPITRMEKFLKEYGGGGGGVSSWNDLTDKPFGEDESGNIIQLDNKYLEPFETVGGDTLTWDGNTEGLACVADIIYKVSDKSFTVEELANAVVILSDGTQITAVESDTMVNDNKLIIISEVVFIATEECIGIDYDGITFNEVGVYFFNTEGLYVSSLTINGYTGFTTTKLKEDCLPSAYMKTTFYNNTSDSYLYKDAGCTQKVASSELSEAIKGIVEIEIIIENAEYIVCTPVYMASYGTIGSVYISYGSVNYDGHKVMMSMALYTAEYAG